MPTKETKLPKIGFYLLSLAKSQCDSLEQNLSHESKTKREKLFFGLLDTEDKWLRTAAMVLCVG